MKCLFSNVAKLFLLYVCAAETKTRLRPKILSTLGMNPTQKARPDLQHSDHKTFRRSGGSYN